MPDADVSDYSNRKMSAGPANTPQNEVLNALHLSPLGGEIVVTRSALSRSFGKGCSQIRRFNLKGFGSTGKNAW